MSAYKKFDPYSAPKLPAKTAKPAKIAKEGTAMRLPRIALASLAELAAVPAEREISRSRSVASSEGPADAVVHERSIPGDWAAGLSAMSKKPCPISVEAKRWLQLQRDAQRFVDQWGQQSAALGWSTLDIFGCHPTNPEHRFDQMGLIWIIAGAEIIAISAEVASIRNSAGTHQRVWKCAADGARVLLWDL